MSLRVCKLDNINTQIQVLKTEVYNLLHSFRTGNAYDRLVVTMPISNGANNWVKSYWTRPPKRPGVHSNVVIVNRPDPPDVKSVSRPPSPQVSYRSPSPPRPPPSPPRPEPPSRRIVEETVRYEQPPPPPSVREVIETRIERPPPPPPPPQMKMTRTHYQRNNIEPYGVGYDRYQYGYNYQNQNDSMCCGNHLFNSGKAGGDTGCCQGGLFSRRVCIGN